MKKIYLIRHAKSSWKNANISDFDRPLNKRGKEDIKFMSKRLKFFRIMPDIIISSPAKRAKKTTEGIASIIGYDESKIVYQPALYESSFETYMDLITNIDDSYNSVFLVAHNPTLTEAGEMLSGAILTNIPTCSIVCIEFDINSFEDIKEGSGKILFFDYPKKHRK
ncbi:MAG: histidine phosphatase family protein [Sulfurospirillaceae bacterium]|nr:histidine phosphatase family protein [Sulfurospirillaceae bacterium]